MDIIKKKTAPFYKKKAVIISAILTFAVLSVFALSNLRISAHSVDSDLILTGQVRQGDFSIKVAGPGVLAPKDVRLVASTVAGRVERIFLRAGAEVKKGQVIVRLENPELVQQTEELAWEVEAMEKEAAALKVQHQTRLMEMRGLMMRNQMEYSVEKIRLEAEKELISKGNATVSKIDYESRKMQVSHFETTLELDKNLLSQLEKNLEAEYSAQEARLNRQKKALERARFQVASLEVRAPVDGILQTMGLDVGQQLVVGSDIARIADKDDLIAELQIPELSASALAIGQRAIVDTRFNQIEGTVTRIDPAVTNGTVLIEVELTSLLPDEARPDLSINGEILITEKPNTLFVRRPAFSKANNVLDVYKINSKTNEAEKVKVQFGVASSLEIEVISGLKAGDQIIVSETTDFATFNKVSIL
ncbi:HlyD family efflux transporter periplasmic adaptor subunit [Pseudoalteromonas sp. OANN1]|uniref:efflux RND transporter periplasmic adaptor subunit n=1 Tax=Pseudoalteromonas sp. OANN1 TaxID=2954497 RepID=UPI002097D463|nr:HlyD family efflux transporter periplasmic adaptor subunit [Pseudoalteromonas sp. OANN1]MCO7199091.1 HlyD family efflux transporter periplasmic adaptor subunit [Pseudoalteromonas sp. OANN1]